jgi:hypothetical protein
MENNNTYTATTVRFSPQGEKLEEVRDFAKQRTGLRDAYEFVQGADEFIIWCGDEIVSQTELEH